MCGIVGYIGAQQAQDILLDGLSRLEYRGYDSAGIAVMDGGVPLWTTAICPFMSVCGWALMSFGSPWVAQRV